jgi:hypothetical protein
LACVPAVEAAARFNARGREILELLALMIGFPSLWLCRALKPGAMQY